MKTRFIITILLALLLAACVGRKAPSNQSNWDNGTWDSTSWQ
jgi:hypothetical protein